MAAAARVARGPVPEPAAGQVLVRVGGAGVCHSDLHLMEWPEGTMPFELPFTLGHENAGWVESVGAGVEGWAPGRRGRGVRGVGMWPLSRLPPIARDAV
jgi:propanol-preferring alcohol dehydrogenase